MTRHYLHVSVFRVYTSFVLEVVANRQGSVTKQTADINWAGIRCKLTI